MKNRPALTVDNATSASNAARAPISRLRYAWFFPVWPLAWTAALLVSAGLVWKLSLWFLPLLLLFLALNGFYWIRVREFFMHGDANPCLVVQLHPDRYHAAPDGAWMDWRGGDYRPGAPDGAGTSPYFAITALSCLTLGGPPAFTMAAASLKKSRPSRAA